MPPTPLNRLFQSLEGTWRFERRITDHAADSTSDVLGQACFLPLSDTRLLFVEEGEHHLPNGTRLTTRRSYHFDLENSTLTLRFCSNPSAGTVYLRLALTFKKAATPWPATAAQEHLCGGDLYRARFNFITSEQFEEHCQTQGPRKDYAFQGFYRRTP